MEGKDIWSEQYLEDECLVFSVSDHFAALSVDDN